MADAGRQEAEIMHHLNAATKAFYACRDTLCNRACNVKLRLRYFHATISQVACFGAGARTPRRASIEAMALWRQLLRQVVGPPPDMDWSQPWRAVLHLWHRRVNAHAAPAGIPTWGDECLSRYWNLARHVAVCPPRWISRMLRWPGPGHLRRGRPCEQWSDPLRRFARTNFWLDWQVVAANVTLWKSSCSQFIRYMRQ
jgi:hypothetical protein